MTPADRNRLTLIIGGAVIIALAAVWTHWFLQNYDRRERLVRGDVAAKARRNPYLAAERYLSRLGYRVDSIRGRGRLKSPPAEKGALVVHDAGPSLTVQDETRLMNWVAEGGHLVLVPRRVFDAEAVSARNNLYERFGVRLHSRRPETAASGGGPASVAAPDIVVAQREAADGAHRVAFDPALYLEHTGPAAYRALSGEHGVHMLAFRNGTGRVTVFSDNGFMLNERIGEYDHAWFLSDLLGSHEQVWFLTDASMPPLTDMMWRYAPEATLSGILLALLWLWRAGTIHGPRLRGRSRGRRDITEHLEAVAAYAWYRDPSRELMHRSRLVVEQQWRRRYPKLNRMDESYRCAWIADRVDMKEEAVRRALYASPDDEQSLIDDTAVQQKLVRFLSQRTDPIEERV